MRLSLKPRSAGASVLALVCVVASSCVATKADFDRVQYALEDHRRATMETLEELEAGTISQSDAQLQLSAAAQAAKAEIESVRQDIVQRVDDVTAQVTSYQGMTGNPLFDLVLGGVSAVMTGGGAVLATNRIRDGRRRERGEVVGHQPARAVYGYPTAEQVAVAEQRFRGYAPAMQPSQPPPNAPG